MSVINYFIFETTQVDFIVFNSPNRDNQKSIDELNNIVNLNNIKIIFRLCEPLYDSNNIYNCKIIDMIIEDGSFPSSKIINDYLLNIQNCIKSNNVLNTKTCIGIHCKAGLGRAPIFAAIGLMNYSSYYDFFDIVKLIRYKIKGSINKVQLNGLSKYKPKKKSNNCVIC